VILVLTLLCHGRPLQGITLLCHGCPLQGIVAAFGFDERAVAQWQALVLATTATRCIVIL